MCALVDRINFMGQTYETPKQTYLNNKRSWVYYVCRSIWSERRVTPNQIRLIFKLTTVSVRRTLKLIGVIGIIEFVLPNLKSAIVTLEGLQDPFQIGRHTNSAKKSVLYKKYCGVFITRVSQLVEYLVLEYRCYIDTVRTSQNPLVNCGLRWLCPVKEAVWIAIAATLRYTALSIQEAFLKFQQTGPTTLRIAKVLGGLDLTTRIIKPALKNPKVVGLVAALLAMITMRGLLCTQAIPSYVLIVKLITKSTGLTAILLSSTLTFVILGLHVAALNLLNRAAVINKVYKK
jgi:predicted aconitase with swiveling domain